MRSMSSSSPRPIRRASGRSSKRPVFFRTGLGTLASLGGRVPVLLTLRINLSSLALRGRSVTTTLPKMLIEFSGVATGVAAFESPVLGAADKGESRAGVSFELILCVWGGEVNVSVSYQN